MRTVDRLTFIIYIHCKYLLHIQLYIVFKALLGWFVTYRESTKGYLESLESVEVFDI